MENALSTNPSNYPWAKGLVRSPPREQGSEGAMLESAAESSGGLQSSAPEVGWAQGGLGDLEKVSQDL